MQWEVIVENIRNFFSQPVPIIGCTIGFLLASILTIVSKTSIGKKALCNLSKMYEDSKAKYAKIEADHNKMLDDSLFQIEELKESYRQESIKFKEENEELKQLIFDIAENIHNVKIQELIAKYKEEKENGGENTNSIKEEI